MRPSVNEAFATVLPVVVLLFTPVFILPLLWLAVGGRPPRKRLKLYLGISAAAAAVIFFYAGPLRFKWYPPARRELISPVPVPSAGEAGIKGLEAAEEGNWAAARNHFRDACYTVPVSPQSLYNMALACDRSGGHEIEAVAWYGAWLAAVPDAPARNLIESRLRAVAKKARERYQVLLASAAETVSAMEIRERKDNEYTVPDADRKAIFQHLARSARFMFNDEQAEKWLERAGIDDAGMSELPARDEATGPRVRSADSILAAGDAVGSIEVLLKGENPFGPASDMAASASHNRARKMFMWMDIADDSVREMPSCRDPEGWSSSLRGMDQPHKLALALAREAEASAYYMKRLWLTDQSGRWRHFQWWQELYEKPVIILFMGWVLAVIAMVLAGILELALRLFGRSPGLFRGMLARLAGYTALLVLIGSFVMLEEVWDYFTHRYRTTGQASAFVGVYLLQNVLVLALLRLRSILRKKGKEINREKQP